MRNSTLLYGRDLLWIASEMLEILTIIFRIIFNNNPCRPCVPWMFSCFARNNHRNLDGNKIRENLYNPCAVLNDGEDQKASMMWSMVWVVSGVPTMEMMSKRRSPS